MVWATAVRGRSRRAGSSSSHRSSSSLYRMATVSLLVRSDMISFVDSMAAPLSLLNALIVAVGRQKNEEVSGTFSQLENVWSKYNIFGKTEDES